MGETININSLQIERKKKVNDLLSSNELSQRLGTLFSVKQLEKFKSNVISICLDKNMQDCQVETIIKGAKALAELGLDINPLLGQAYIVKYKKDAQPIIGYKGYITLAERFGKKIKAYCVYKCDNFVIDYSGVEDNLTFIPNMVERDETNKDWFNDNIVCVLVKIIENNTYSYHIVSEKKIKQITGMSRSKDSDYSPYKQWYEEMYLAKAIKYVLSRMPMNDSIQEAINIDNQLDKELIKDIEKSSKDVINAIIDDDDTKDHVIDFE